uniref:Uncharacterized protein n=1 Tax=Sphaerodactylus townsendi TaxID=933632 RepID=A0ACB8F7N5_9SAUR
MERWEAHRMVCNLWWQPLQRLAPVPTGKLRTHAQSILWRLLADARPVLLELCNGTLGLDLQADRPESFDSHRGQEANEGRSSDKQRQPDQSINNSNTVSNTVSNIIGFCITNATCPVNAIGRKPERKREGRRHFLIGTMEVPSTGLRAVTIPPGIPEADVMFRTEAAYQRFWDSCRVAQRAREPDFEFLELQPLFRGETQVVTVYLRSGDVPKEDIAQRLSREGRVLMAPREKQDEFGIWTCEYKLIMGLDRTPEGRLRHLPRQTEKEKRQAKAGRILQTLGPDINRFALLQEVSEEEMQQGGETAARRNSDGEQEKMEWLSGTKPDGKHPHSPRGSKRRQRSPGAANGNLAGEEGPERVHIVQMGGLAEAVTQQYQPLERREENPPKSRKAEGKDRRGRTQLPVQGEVNPSSSTVDVEVEAECAMETTPTQIKESGGELVPAEQAGQQSETPQLETQQEPAVTDERVNREGVDGGEPESSGTPLRPSQTPHMTPVESEDGVQSPGGVRTEQKEDTGGGMAGLAEGDRGDRIRRQVLWARLKDVTAEIGPVYVILGNFNNRARPEDCCTAVRRAPGELGDGRRVEFRPAALESLNGEERGLNAWLQDEKGLRDAAREAGPMLDYYPTGGRRLFVEDYGGLQGATPFTFFHPRFRSRLDRVWASPELHVVACRTLLTPWSAHSLLEVRIRNEQPIPPRRSTWRIPYEYVQLEEGVRELDRVLQQHLVYDYDGERSVAENWEATKHQVRRWCRQRMCRKRNAELARYHRVLYRTIRAETVLAAGRGWDAERL